MRKLLVPLLAAIAFPTAVNAEIVYLDCDLTNSYKTLEVGITLNESQGKVTYLIKKTGSSKTLPAIFNQKSILFGNDIAKWQINRTDGTISRRMSYVKDPNENGKCKKVEKPKKMF
tara:strand:+ start:169 stop:516 length:348 start_codon:yes stop_codon:yes gene_type:complete